MSRQAVATLEGAALAYAVAVAEGREPILLPPTYGLPWRVAVIETGRLVAWRPERDWVQCGLLIEKHKIELLYFGSKGRDGNPWEAQLGCDSGYIDQYPGWATGGHSALVAACRALAVAILGETVELPFALAAA